MKLTQSNSANLTIFSFATDFASDLCHLKEYHFEQVIPKGKTKKFIKKLLILT